MPDYKFMSVKQIKPYIAEMEDKQVSKVARAPGGFLYKYMNEWKTSGNIPPEWKTKRNNFIKRHMAQYKSGERRRALAMIAWAYNPGIRVLKPNSG